ncbi:putative glutathione S-transferase [Talaromyces proteolyticus]|uniref:glutathione transferase n=1 Tax=Talaromyces proteolyticus TaxID=1131652 RepID=A0AAD4KX33_9EURO|nr:putative glutathione S-transferase [Talaromyces proteolyticus]KAH8698808.1 putative glutathione S-transferase [Talaromyces proteolyticus]
MVLLIHGSSLSPCTKRVQVVFHEKGIPFEFNPVDLSKGEQKSELHVQKQPFGKVPVLEEDGFMLYESRAICQYIAAKYRDQGTDLFPDNDNVEEFALLQQGICAELSNFDPVAFGICNEKMFKAEPADEIKVAELSAKLKSVLAGYERILVKQKYFTGHKLSLADLFHLPYASLLETLGYGGLFAEFPAFNSWLKGLQARDSWKTVSY